ncbi:hypothetical protein PIB30_063212 [Stylosanthes scabra]|uniref:Putative plant transposon protein domain-containing protein n=1 Tax=Stylosanthes scabra TaxID=79078 RepID=A0ABU6ZK40_9FABA|nr:hypothetical protein [Stylosanthes scabra]
MAPKSRKRSAQDAPSASYVPGVPDETVEPPYDAIRFRSLAHQKHFFEWVQNRTPNVEEFYANAKKSKRERALNPPVYISRIRGKDLDYSPESLKVILQLPDVDVEGPTYEVRRNSNDLRLGEVLRDIGEEHAQWKLDIKGNPCQLRRYDLKPTARAWLDFVRRSLIPTSNANEVTVERAVLIHSIMEGLSIKAELLISKNISAAAESKDPNKRLPFTGVIYKLLFANGFKKKVQGDELIPIEKPITAEKYNWQELTQQFQGMRVEQNNQFKDFFDRQNSFFEEMHTQTKAYKQGFEDMRVQQHKINSKNEQKIDYLCWGVQQVNPYLKGRLPEDIPEWMQANLQAGRGRFHDGMSRTPRDCWPGATSRGPASTSNEEDKGKGKAEEGDNDECGKKKAWEARDKDLNQ